MFIVCWSAKGGSGTTVVAAALAVLLARADGHRPTTIVDLGGDVPAALGTAAPTGPGVAEWLAAPSAPDDALVRLAAPTSDGLQVVHRGVGDDSGGPPDRWPSVPDWERIARACVAGAGAGHVILDAGRDVPDAVVHDAADRSVLVTRACYLSLRRSRACSSLASDVILITEPGRALDARDVAHALGVPVLAEIPWDPAVARSVDSGLLRARLPIAMVRPLRRLTIHEVVR
jgi:hypothetical protein